MLSLMVLKNNFYAFFRVLSTTDAYIDVAHKGRVYRVFVEDLHKDAPPQRRRKRKRALAINKAKCAKCGGLMLNGVCMAAIKHD